MRSEPSRRSLLGSAGFVVFTGCVDELRSSADEPTSAGNETVESDDTNAEPADEGDADDTEAGDDESTANGDDDESESEDDADESADDEDAIHEDYESTDVRVATPDGEELGAVTAAIADTGPLRGLGLSDTEHLPSDRGMLFVYEDEDDRTFYMREMDFGIDIVFADADGRITAIHHAPAPGPDEDGTNQRYGGYGQYVLEVTYEWTAERGVSEGDVLEFELPDD